MAARPIFQNYCLLKPILTKQKKETIYFLYLESKVPTTFLFEDCVLLLTILIIARVINLEFHCPYFVYALRYSLNYLTTIIKSRVWPPRDDYDHDDDMTIIMHCVLMITVY